VLEHHADLPLARPAHVDPYLKPAVGHHSLPNHA
jgi:hypothetical protein